MIFFFNVLHIQLSCSMVDWFYGRSTSVGLFHAEVSWRTMVSKRL